MRTQRGDGGYAMAALLVAMSVMGIMISIALPVWQTWVQREKEAELVFRAEQYAQAIDRFSRQTGGFPTSLKALADGKFIRKLYIDPITGREFQPVYLGQIGAAGRQGAPPTAGRVGGAGPIIGVVSTSTAKSLRLYNGRSNYNEWVITSTAATQEAGTGARGTQAPGRGVTGRQGLNIGRGTRGSLPGRGQPGRGGLGMPGQPIFPGQPQVPNQPGQPGRGRL